MMGMTKICDHCGRAGRPYEYRGRQFDGLHANRGERLCSPCLQSSLDADGVTILVRTRDGREYVMNSVADAGKVFVGDCPVDIGDGRDFDMYVRRAQRAARKAARS